MKLFTLLMPIIAAQGSEIDERLVNFQRLPKVFDWYEEVIRRFVPNRKEGKYIHRIGQLKQRIVWEAERCPKAGPQANNGKNGRFADEDGLVLGDFEDSMAELEQMMTDGNYLVKVSEDFEYEENDELYTPDEESNERKIGNRPSKPGKNTAWKATTNVENPMLGSVARPPRVLVYRLNKTIIKWFNNFMPAECRKFTRIYKRMKGLKRQITRLVPKHEYIYDEVTGEFVQA